MFIPKTETEEFHAWLDRRMKESDLTTNEIAEFTRWLMVRPSHPVEKEHGDGTVSFTEAIQLVTWLKGRMFSTGLGDADRRELSNWLTDRLTDNSCLTEEELSRVHNELSDKL